MTPWIGNYLLLAQSLVNMNKPSDRDHRSVVNFIENYQPLAEADRGFVYQKEDLVALRNSRDITWLDRGVERFLWLIRCKPIEVSILVIVAPNDSLIRF